MVTFTAKVLNGKLHFLCSDQSLLRKRLLDFIRPIRNITHQILGPLGMKLLNRLGVGFSRLQEHKSGHNFAETLQKRHYMHMP